MAAFVDGGLTPQRRSILHAHIADCARCRGLLGDAAYGAMSTRNTQGRAEERSEKGWGKLPAKGDIVGEKYEIEKVVGRGGMGAVYSARHRELGHQVAIKVLFTEHGDEGARFLREAQTCARLSSDHITRVFDVGRLDTGAPFLVMELLHGSDLSGLGTPPVPVAVGYLLQACAGVAEAHAAGVVHRDLKLQNLFLTTRADGSPQVKVLDFGISKRVRGGAAEGGVDEVSLTTTESFLGSPLYMSPEQLRDSKDVDGRTDIWSLGVILYRLLTGKAPFPGTSLPAVALAIAMEKPAVPSTLRADIPPGLDAVILRCLQKDRAHRYATVGELVAALRPFATSLESSALGMTVPPAPARGRAGWAAVSIGLVIMLLAGGAIGAWKMRASLGGLREASSAGIAPDPTQLAVPVAATSAATTGAGAIAPSATATTNLATSAAAAHAGAGPKGRPGAPRATGGRAPTAPSGTARAPGPLGPTDTPD